jgi:hypothetical protein
MPWKVAYRILTNMSNPQKKIWSPDLTELDKIELIAFWIKGTEPTRFAVERLHGGNLRSYWEFEYIGENRWECTRGTPIYLREQPITAADSNARRSDTSRIPADIKLKAREFLAQTLKIKPKPTQRKTLRATAAKKNQSSQLP